MRDFCKISLKKRGRCLRPGIRVWYLEFQLSDWTKGMKAFSKGGEERTDRDENGWGTQGAAIPTHTYKIKGVLLLKSSWKFSLPFKLTA